MLESTVGSELRNVRIAIPNDAALQNVKKVAVVVNQNTAGDNSANFNIRALTFQHISTVTQPIGDINPNAALNSSNVTVCLERHRSQPFHQMAEAY